MDKRVLLLANVFGKEPEFWSVDDTLEERKFLMGELKTYLLENGFEKKDILPKGMPKNTKIIPLLSFKFC